ncbi:glycoside hydrolase [Pedobacter sp. BS3]|uniref:GH39 family glycosyl hydrolase n=1 Tax=Pedobacter sp. BS3 TaxID=2567937 RepID=UPI0011EF12E0|nr:glycoside hydrolase [Pedobacter sp. BS3]TZF81008.1 glycoside hydrolase [Pedobacter sp. BS3]
MKLQACLLSGALFVQTLYAQMLPVREISVDLNQVAGNKSPVYTECVGAGRAGEGLRADWQQQLAAVQKDIGFKYIRFHGLLNDDMHIYSLDKQGNVVYNWQYVDKLYDYLLSIHIRPFVELGFMPPDLASGTKTVFWWKGNVTKPKSYDEWDKLISKLVTHWQERYGREEVEKWYFEVWNEPDLRGFFDGTQADYFELYAHTAKAVKSVSSGYRVGGPATSATKWIAEFLDYCTTNKLPVDFVSTHDYGTTSVLDEFGTKKQKLKSTQDTIAMNVKRVRDLINNSAYKNAELHFTEWNTSPSSRDPIHDTYQNAAYVLHVLKKAVRNSNSMSYWTFTDIFEEAGPGPTPLHGGFGLLNLQDIRKPTYYAYKFLNELGSAELKNTDASSLVCKQGQNVQALIWDFTMPGKDYDSDQGYFIKEHPSTVKQTARLVLTHVKKGKYRVELYQVGYRHNDPFTAYIAMGKPAQVTPAQVAELKKQSSGLPVSSYEVNITDGTFRKDIPLRDNDIIFVKLIRLD